MLTDTPNPYEGVPDDRTHIQKQIDANWSPTTVPQDGEHRFDATIEEYNRLADEATAPREPNRHRRLASYMADMKEKEFAAVEAATDAQEHLDSVQPQLDKIRQLRAAMLENKELYVVSDFVNLGKAEALYSTPGANKSEANNFYQATARKAQVIVDHAEQQRQIKIAALENQINELRKVPKPIVEVESGEPEADAAAKRIAVKRAANARHYAKLRELIVAGEYAAYEELHAKGPDYGDN